MGFNSGFKGLTPDRAGGSAVHKLPTQSRLLAFFSLLCQINTVLLLLLLGGIRVTYSNGLRSLCMGTSAAADANFVIV